MPEVVLMLVGLTYVCFCLVCVLPSGDFITNSTNNKRTRVPRLVRIHSDELEDIASAVRGGSRWAGVLFAHPWCAM